MKYNKISLVSIFIFIIISLTSVFAQSCSPSNCKANCSPSCSSDEVCTLGTMVTCGVCPTSKCLPKSSFPSYGNSNSSSSKSSNSGLIGGLVGGLIGGGLLIGGAIYFCIRKRNKKNNLPLAFRHKLNNTTEMQQRNTTTSTASVNNRQVISGVIPVTFIPPTNSTHTSFYSEAETPRSHIGSFATFANNDNENPFTDRPISTAESFLTTTTNTDYRRDSIESNISQQPTRAVVQATQVLRAKPQIMRVNTVRVQDGVTRSGSLKKTIQPQEPAVENPFDDSNVARQSVQSIQNISSSDSIVDARSNKVTDSVVSTAADGEITIFFNGN